MNFKSLTKGPIYGGNKPKFSTDRNIDLVYKNGELHISIEGFGIWTMDQAYDHLGEHLQECVKLFLEHKFEDLDAKFRTGDVTLYLVRAFMMMQMKANQQKGLVSKYEQFRPVGPKNLQAQPEELEKELREKADSVPDALEVPFEEINTKNTEETNEDGKERDTVGQEGGTD